jgi:hypothetical protein
LLMATIPLSPDVLMEMRLDLYKNNIYKKIILY